LPTRTANTIPAAISSSYSLFLLITYQNNKNIPDNDVTALRTNDHSADCVKILGFVHNQNIDAKKDSAHQIKYIHQSAPAFGSPKEPILQAK